MNAGKDISYEEAKKIANKTLKAIADNNIEDHECIDVQIARAIGVRPLPMRVHRQVPADNTVVVDDSTVQKKPEAASSETTTNAPKEKKKKEVKTEETVVSTAEVPSAEQPTGNEITTSDESAAKKDIVYSKARRMEWSVILAGRSEAAAANADIGKAEIIITTASKADISLGNFFLIFITSCPFCFEIKNNA